ncbi:hypothetical protein [Flavobacterium sp. MK4S-17]|uniref:hypothetical protein n=1 Tax=Flavobacterium sp. MK4S-17 TaxID=2543737 RepID=UPI00135B9DFC|nr:hypothetical protein [Flavobacterium sp. MK4S-17]
MKKITLNILGYAAAILMVFSISACGDNRNNNTDGNDVSGESTTTTPGTGGVQEGQGTTTGSPQNPGDTLNSTTYGNSTIGNDADSTAQRP